MRITASFAPPWRGPYRAAAEAAMAEYGSTREEPTCVIVDVEQFISWSAWRMKRISRAFARRGSGLKEAGSERCYG